MRREGSRSAERKRRLRVGCRNCAPDCALTGVYPRQTPSLPGKHRETLSRSEVVEATAEKVFRSVSTSLHPIAFQACSFIRLRSRLSPARATARCLAVAAPPRRRTTTRTSLRLDSTTCERSKRHYRARLRHDRICAQSSFYSTGFGVGHDLRAQELCQTSECGQISTPIDSARAVASGHNASRAAG